MPDIFGINYNGVNPRPTYEELINFVDYPIKYPDRTATFTRDSPLLTQLDGVGMMELEEMERNEKIERYKDDLIRQIAYNTGHPAQLLRAMNRRRFVPSMASLADSRDDGDYQDMLSEIGSQEYESNEALLARIRAMGDEASSSAESSLGIGDRLAGLAVSPGFYSVPTGSGDLTPGPEPGPEPVEDIMRMREELEALTDEDLDYYLREFKIDYGPNSTRDYKIRKILEAQEDYRSPPRSRPEVFPISTPPSKRSRGSPPPSPPSSENPFVPPNASPYRGAYQAPYNLPRTNYIPPYSLAKPPPRRANLSEYELPKPPPIAVPPKTLVIPKTQTPEYLRGASGSGGEAAAAAAVERRPVPPRGLSLHMLQDYSEDEVDAELRALGIHVGNMSLWDKKKAIANHYHHFSKSPGKKASKAKAEAKASAKAIPPGRTTGSISGPSDLLVHDQAIRTGLPVAEIRKIHKMTVPMLKGELVRRGFFVRTDTSKNEMIEKLILIYAEKRRERRDERTLQRHMLSSSLESRTRPGSPMDVDHTPGG